MRGRAPSPSDHPKASTRSTSATSATTSSARRCTPTARSGPRRTSTSAELLLGSTAHGLPGAADRVRDGTRPPRGVPGQPPLDSTLLRRDGADAGRAAMLEARNAILAADMSALRRGQPGHLWHAFATRGLRPSRHSLSTGGDTPAEAGVRLAAARGGDRSVPRLRAGRGQRTGQRQRLRRSLRGTGLADRGHESR